MIHVEQLSKQFQTYDKMPGLKNSLKSLVNRQYRTVHAVKDITFTVQEGEFVGFIGPNGAGKTTTLKMLSGLLHPSKGEVSVFGHKPQLRQKSFLKGIGYVAGQKQQIPLDLTPGDAFLLNKAVYEISDSAYRGRLSELTTILELSGLLNKQVKRMSLGERMRCELAVSLLHNPRVLFLDEPTIGLDVTMQTSMRQFLRDHNTMFSTTILMTSHYMHDIAELAKRIIVISRGGLVYDGSLENLIKSLNIPQVLKVKFGEVDIDLKYLNSIAPAKRISNSEIHLQVLPNEVPKVIASLTQNFSVLSLIVQEAPLEDIMLNVFSQKENNEFAL